MSEICLKIIHEKRRKKKKGKRVDKRAQILEILEA